MDKENARAPSLGDLSGEFGKSCADLLKKAREQALLLRQQRLEEIQKKRVDLEKLSTKIEACKVLLAENTQAYKGLLKSGIIPVDEYYTDLATVEAREKQIRLLQQDPKLWTTRCVLQAELATFERLSSAIYAAIRNFAEDIDNLQKNTELRISALEQSNPSIYGNWWNKEKKNQTNEVIQKKLLFCTAITDMLHNRFLGNIVVAGGNIEVNSNTRFSNFAKVLEVGTDLLSAVPIIDTFGGNAAAVVLGRISRLIEGKEQKKEKKNREHVAALVSYKNLEHVTYEMSELLAYRYQGQIRFVAENGATQLGKAAAQCVLDYAKTIPSDQPYDTLIKKMSEGVTGIDMSSGNISNPKMKRRKIEIETKDGLVNWKDQSVFRGSCIKIIRPEGGATIYYNNILTNSQQASYENVCQTYHEEEFSPGALWVLTKSFPGKLEAEQPSYPAAKAKNEPASDLSKEKEMQQVSAALSYLKLFHQQQLTSQSLDLNKRT